MFVDSEFAYQDANKGKYFLLNPEIDPKNWGGYTISLNECMETYFKIEAVNNKSEDTARRLSTYTRLMGKYMQKARR